MTTFTFYFLLTLLVSLATLLVALILIQKGRGGGLSGTFGGSGAGSKVFGPKTGGVMTWATYVGFFLFLLAAVALDLKINHQFGTASGANAQAVVPTQSVSQTHADASSKNQALTTATSKL